LLRLPTSTLFVFALAGCSFDASKLRGHASSDAAPANDLLFATEHAPPDPTSGDAPDAPPDLAQNGDVNPDEGRISDSSASDRPTGLDASRADTENPVPPDTAIELDGELDVAVSDDTGLLADSAPSAIPSDGDDAVVSLDVSGDDAALDGLGDTPVGTDLDLDTLAGGLDKADLDREEWDSAGAGGAGGAGGTSATGGTGAGGASATGGTGGAGGSGGTSAAGGTTADAGADAGGANAIVEYELPNPDCQPWALTAGPDNTLWIAARATGKIVRFTIADHSFREFDAGTAASQIEGIALGSDNNIWFTEYGTDRIGRLTLDGDFEEYNSTTGSGPNALVAGPDGNLWFTEMDANRIGRITTAGVITHYDIPTLSSQPARIAVGPDGNIWFTEYGANRIGYLAPTTPTPGPIRSYAINSLSSYPSGIAGDLDGHLWFYESGLNRIARMTTTGTIDEFQVPTANGMYTRATIVLGPDNNMWFSEMNASQIGRVSPSGSISEYPTPTKSSAPYGIVKGPDGLVWFTESSSGKLASIVP
jgi:virginiamycin B lyase